MAAQIARLRLFVALQAAERGVPRRRPLPNLEARIVCADTLRTHPLPGYDPFARPNRGVDGAQVTLAGANGGLRDAVREPVAVREEWPGDRSEAAERARRAEDRRARERLRAPIDGDALAGDAGGVRLALAGYPLLEPDHDEAAPVGPRLPFAQDEERWRGFDVAIGNPPCRSFAGSGVGGAERAALEERGYRATEAGDLCALFCEAALALARPDGGVATLVVPLSIAFGRRQRRLRDIFRDRCARVSARHYGNIPDTIFDAHPLFKGWKNRQRTTIVTAVRGEGPAGCERARWCAGAPPPRRAASAGRGSPRRAVAAPPRRRGGRRGPHDRPPAHRHRGLARAGARRPRRAGAVAAEERRTLRGRVAARHAQPGRADGAAAARRGNAPAGDGRARRACRVRLVARVRRRLPRQAVGLRGLRDSRRLARRGRARQGADFGRRLVAAVPASRKDRTYARRHWENVDFLERQPGLIEELDCFHIGSLGLDPGTLLPHLRRMRSPDGWDFGQGGPPAP